MVREKNPAQRPGESSPSRRECDAVFDQSSTRFAAFAAIIGLKNDERTELIALS